MTAARMAFYQNPNYLTWLRAEASEINTDGCSGVSGVMVECCYQHDLEYFHGKCAHDAYRLMKRGVPNYWQCAKEITFDQANANKRRCVQARSKFGMYSPLALWRWLGLKYLSKPRRAWDAHRERDAERKTEPA